MHQDQLFKLAPEALSVSARFVGGEGWSVVVAMRRQGEPGESAYRATYSHLGTSELADVIEREVASQLDLL